MGSMLLLRGSVCAFFLACTAAWAADPVRIGFVNELTGVRTRSASQHSAAMAVEEINRDGGVLGRPLELMTADSQGTVPGALLATSKLLADPALAGMILPPDASQTIAVLPSIARRRIPVMVSAPHSALTQSGIPWVFRVGPNWSYGGRAIAEFGVGTLQKNRWVIVYSQDATGLDCKDRITAPLKALGRAPVAVEGIDPTTRNAGAVVGTVRSAKADIVVACIGRGPIVSEFAKELRRQGVTADLIGFNNMTSAASLRAAGEALQGAFSVASYLESASPAAKEFARRYRQRWEIKTVDSAWAYDAVRLLAAAMNKAGSTNPDAVRAALLQVRGYEGATGTFNFDEHGDGLHSVNIVRNEGKKRVFVKRMSYEPGS